MGEIKDLSIIMFLSFAIFGNTASLSRASDANVYQNYHFESTVLLDEWHHNSLKNEDEVAQQITGSIRRSIIWQNSNNEEPEKLFYFQLASLKLFIKKNKKNISSEEEFVEQSIKDYKNEPFLIHWKKNKIENIYVNSEEETFIINLKKAISSLFQFRTSHSHVEEADICGTCSVKYENIDSKTILKHKENCKSHLPVTPIRDNVEKILGLKTKIERKVLYEFNEHMQGVIRITSYENLNVNLNMRNEIGISVTTIFDVNYIETEPSDIPMSSMKTLNEAIDEFTYKFNYKLNSDTLYVTEEPTLPTEKKSLAKMIQEKREYLKEENLGTIESVKVFLEILKAVHSATENEIINVLKNKKNESIINQIMDILGHAQTLNAHNAVMKTFDFTSSVTTIDSIERYLWAISIGRNPHLKFLKDLIREIKKKPKSDKLVQTLILTLAALAKKISNDTVMEVYLLITESLEDCENNNDDDCTANYLRALKNLNHSDSKSLLLHYALTGTRVVCITALKVLYSLPCSVWDSEVLKVVEKIYYQKDKIYDSSARAIAVDIIVDTIPDTNTLRHLVKSLTLNTSSEVRRYLLQRLNQLASTNETFSQNLKRVLIEENLNHYAALALRGLSNALTKNIFEDRDLNASLFSINEVSKGILKRSYISVILSQNDSDWKLGSFEIFSSGLSSFLWSDNSSDEEELEEGENLTAGIELTIFGVQLRPFVFFNGHGELMGHIWSGTASERTTAFQALTLLHDYRQLISLATGNVLTINLLGASSFDLAGQIQFSLWNRNARSLMESKIGVTVQGSASINSPFAANKIDFEIGSEQKVEMTADLDFYNEIAFCLQISQINSLVKGELEKSQRVHYNGYEQKKKKRKRLLMPGCTYALNQKNNEMCNEIYKQHQR